MGISKLPVSTKMDEENVMFLDWLSKQGKPFPTSRSWWNNECISLIRMMFRSGQIGVPISSLQGIPGILVGIPRIPQFPAPQHEVGLPTTANPSQAHFNFFSRLTQSRSAALVLEVEALGTSLSAKFRFPFASRRLA